MGCSFGDGDDKIKPSKRSLAVHLSDTDNHTFDSQFYSQSLSGGEVKDGYADELQFLQSTMAFDDTVLLEDAFATQVMNFGGETQVVNLGGETQTLDNLDRFENIGTQWLDDDCGTEVVTDTDGGPTKVTEVMCDTGELFDDDSANRVCTQPVDQKNIPHTAPCKEFDAVSKAEPNALSSAKDSSESVCRDFTSVRVASIRTSGLAARDMAFKGINMSDSQSLDQLNAVPSGFTSVRVSSIRATGLVACKGINTIDSQSLKQLNTEHEGTYAVGDPSKSVKEIDHEHTLGKYDEQMKRLTKENKCSARPVARELFTENTLVEIKGHDENVNSADVGADSPLLFACEDELAGLSYVDSHEPEELSEANAIDFVDRFLKVNDTEFDQEVDIRKSTGGKSKPVSIAKGAQTLAKSANLANTVGERGTFDWDDSREDEGGGEFFRKKKEVFFGTGSQRQRSSPKDKVTGVVCPDSKLVLHNLKGNDGPTRVTTKFRRNLIKELDEELNKASTDRIVETSSDKGVPDILNTEETKTRVYTRGKSAKNMRKGSPKGETKNRVYTRQSFLKKRAYFSNPGVIPRQSKQTKGTAAKLSKDPSFSSLRRSTKNRNQCDRDLVKAELKRAKSDDKEQFATNGSQKLSKVSAKIIGQRREQKAMKRSSSDENDKCHVSASSDRMSKKLCVQEQLGTFTPIACRTRQSLVANQSNMGGDASSDFRENKAPSGLGALKDKRKGSRTEVAAFAKDKSTEMEFDAHEESDSKISATTSPVKIDIGGCPSQRTRQKLSSVGQETHGKPLARLRTDATGTCVDLGMKRKTRSSVCAGLVLRSGKRLFKQNVQTGSSEDHSVNCASTAINGNVIAKDVVEPQASKHTQKSDADIKSPRERCKPSVSACDTPVNCTTPINEASPICMGDEYLKQSRRKNMSKLSLMKEINSLSAMAQEHTSPIKDLRKKRDMASVQVFFSHHLDGDIIKQQKKVLARLGASVASSISDATHFVADKFVRTRHMLEAIAFGKPIVTHLWLESCGQASCLIDERNYILRDAKKEKEFGFSLPVSLARACQRPLLKGIRVLVTPNTKPGKEILASLVKAVHGLAVERMGSRSSLKNDKTEDNLLVLSCEEDYELCVRFLEKGAAVYSSELLLNGIVTQKLAYQRHRLFADHVKGTCSTVWPREDSDRYRPLTKCK